MSMGERIGQALASAGLVSAPITWDDAGNVYGRENLSPSQRSILDEVIAYYCTSSKVLMDYKEDAMSKVDAEAERERLCWITGGAGQAMVYSRKSVEAAAIIIASDTDLVDETAARTRWPLVSAAVGLTVPCTGVWVTDLRSAANQVRDVESVWISAAQAIESVRLRAKNDISSSQSKQEIDSIIFSIAWPSR